MTEMYRISITISDEIRDEVEKLKKDKYYNSSYAELYRQVIIAGLEEVKKVKE